MKGDASFAINSSKYEQRKIEKERRIWLIAKMQRWIDFFFKLHKIKGVVWCDLLKPLKSKVKNK